MLHRRPAPPRHRRGGVEISDDAVRVVELSGGYATTPARTAVIPLPADAVRDGEIRDDAAVAASIRAGWREAGLRTRSVVVGLGVHSTVERIVELPPLRRRDLRSALVFELADVLPFPVEESVIEPIEVERVTDPSGHELVRYLCLVAHRPAVIEVVRTVKAAGLRVLALDIIGLAALRSVRCADQQPGIGAVVALGHGTLSVVVHRDGRPLFVRGIAVSSGSIGVSGELAQELSAIDSLRSGDSIARGSGTERDNLAETVLATLAYHDSLEPELKIDRIDVMGRCDRAPLVARELAAATDLEVSLLSLDEVPHLEPIETGHSNALGSDGDHGVALGLAIASRNDATGTAWPKLEPGNTEDIGRRRRRDAVYGAAAGVAVVACGALLAADPAPALAESAAVGHQLSQVTDELDALEDAADAATDTDRLERLVAEVQRSAVPWVELTDALRESAPPVSTVLAVDGIGPSSGEPGSVTLTIETSDPAEIEQWLSLLTEIGSLRDPWLLETAESGAGGGSTVFIVQAGISVSGDDTAEGDTAEDEE